MSIYRVRPFEFVLVFTNEDISLTCFTSLLSQSIQVRIRTYRRPPKLWTTRRLGPLPTCALQEVQGRREESNDSRKGFEADGSWILFQCK